MPRRTPTAPIVEAIRTRPQTVVVYSREPSELREVLRRELCHAGVIIERLVGDVIECANGSVITVTGLA